MAVLQAVACVLIQHLDNLYISRLYKPRFIRATASNPRSESQRAVDGYARLGEGAEDEWVMKQIQLEDNFIFI